VRCFLPNQVLSATPRERDQSATREDKTWKASAYDWARDSSGSVLIEMAKSTPYPPDRVVGQMERATGLILEERRLLLHGGDGR
jgi:hypothetical protein